LVAEKEAFVSSKPTKTMKLEQAGRLEGAQKELLKMLLPFSHDSQYGSLPSYLASGKKLLINSQSQRKTRKPSARI